MALMVQENEILAMWTKGRRVSFWLSDPEECKACHVMHYFFVNVDGKTTCTACAPDEGK